MYTYKRLMVDESEATLETINQIATWHNEIPRIWMPNFEATHDDRLKTIQRIINTEAKDLFIAVAEDSYSKPVGYVWAYKMDEPTDSVMILSLYVIDELRKQGIATTLKNMLETWCNEKQIKTIQTTVHYKNKRMLELNEKLGYAPGMVNMSKRLD